MYVMADLGLDEGPIEEQLSVGILGVLSPAVQQVDSKITEVRCVVGMLRWLVPQPNTEHLQQLYSLRSAIYTSAQHYSLWVSMSKNSI